MSDEVMPLSSILDTNAAPAKAPDPAPAPQDDAKPADQATPDTAKGEDPGVTPAPKAEEPKTAEPVKDDPIKVMRKALKATQRELAQLRQARQEQAHPAAPDPIADPQGFQQFTQESVANLLVQERIAALEESARDKYGDDAYESMLETFGELAQQNPALVMEARNQRNPIKFIVAKVEEAKAREVIGDPRQFAEKIRSETRAEMEAKVKELVAEGIKAALGQHLPQSLADEQTQGTRAPAAQVDWEGPKPLDQILSRKR